MLHHPRWQGTLAPPGYALNTALEMLVGNYKGNEHFMGKLDLLHTRYTEVIHLISQSVREHWPVAVLFTGAIPSFDHADHATLHRWREVPQRIQRHLKAPSNLGEGFREHLNTLPTVLALIADCKSLAERVGLRAPWGLGLILWNLAKGHRCKVTEGEFDEHFRVEVWYPTFGWAHAISHTTPSRSIDLRPLKESLERRHGLSLPNKTELLPETIILALEYNPQRKDRKAFEAEALNALRQQMDAIEEAQVSPLLATISVASPCPTLMK